MENNTHIRPKKLLSVEKKELMKKITKLIGVKLHTMIEMEGWRAKEIFEYTGVAQNRLTELQNFKKYQRPINELSLKLFIRGGIVTVKELKELNNLSEREVAYLETFLLHEDKEAGVLAREVVKRGGSVSKILKEWLSKNAK
jgi:hypothetical protein